MVTNLLHPPLEVNTKSADHKSAGRSVRDVRNFKYSVVVPVFNGADKIEELFRRIADTFDARQCRYEIVIVNDGSTDNTWSIIKTATVKNPNVVAIDLTRNFGQHPAVLCGLAHSSGDYMLTIDADLQNPPEELFKLIEPAVERELELIFAKFSKKQHAFYRNLGSKVISRLNEIIFGKPKNLNISNVRIMSKELVTRMCHHKAPFPYINGLALVCSSPEKRANVIVEHHKRIGSESTYTPVRIAKLVCTILFNYSKLPKLLSNIGYGIAWFSAVLGIAFIAKHYLLSSFLPEFTPVIVVMAFSNALLAFIVGVLAQYAEKVMETASTTSSYTIGSVIKGA